MIALQEWAGHSSYSTGGSPAQSRACCPVGRKLRRSGAIFPGGAGGAESGIGGNPGHRSGVYGSGSFPSGPCVALADAGKSAQGRQNLYPPDRQYPTPVLPGTGCIRRCGSTHSPGHRPAPKPPERILWTWRGSSFPTVMVNTSSSESSAGQPGSF